MNENFTPTFGGKTVRCPICNEITALEEKEKDITSWLCVGCGYSSNSLYKKNSPTIRKVFSSSPKLMNDLKIFDDKRFIYWIPIVINMPNKGLLFPEGTKKQLMWTFVPMVEIPLKEQKNYPIPNSTKFYTKKLDPTQSKKFTRFYDALKEMGAIIQVNGLEKPKI